MSNYDDSIDKYRQSAEQYLGRPEIQQSKSVDKLKNKAHELLNELESLRGQRNEGVGTRFDKLTLEIDCVLCVIHKRITMTDDNGMEGGS